MRTKITLSALFLLCTFYLYSSPAYPGLISYKQSNGEIIKIYLKGDECVKWAETEDNYSIMLNKEGCYEYAIIDEDGSMTLSGIAVHNINDRTFSEQTFLRSIQKRYRYSADQLSIFKQIWELNENEKTLNKSFPTTGNRKLICILMAFSNKPFSKTQSNFNNLFNQVGYNAYGATGSVNDYFLESSYNKFNLSVTVVGPFTAANTMSYYGANDYSGYDMRPRELVTEAVNAADPYVNYADFDNDNDGYVDGVYVIYAGYGEEAGGGDDCIWAHAWSIPPVIKDGKTISRYSCSSELKGNYGSNITNIGVICHEFGHILGAPDYYDTNYETNGKYDGTGEWDLQASGSWNNYGATPAHPNAYTKCYTYNWATPTVLTQGCQLTLLNSTSSNNHFYRYNTTTDNEFFLIENVQKIGFSSSVPGAGLLIYHVDGSWINSHSITNDINTTSHQGLYIMAASSNVANGISVSGSSTINTSGAPFPGSYNKTSFTDQTIPCSKSWNNANTNKPITNITENTSNKTISLKFMGGSSCTPPSQQATSFIASNITDNSIKVSCNRGNGNAILIVARLKTSPLVIPSHGQQYQANSTFGLGSQIGEGNYAVYAGNSSAPIVFVQGLTSGTYYNFDIYEYFNSDYCYTTPPLIGTAKTTGEPPCQYCTSNGNMSYNTSITNVSLNTINNTSAKVNGYSDYTSISTSLYIGNTYQLSVKVNTAGNYKVGARAWIDWNRNCILDDNNEVYNLGFAENESNGLTSLCPLSIIVPSNALLGKTTMRVSCQYNKYPACCVTGFDGEVEDYSIIVTSGCNPANIIIQPIYNQAICTGDTALISISAIGDDPILYEWQFMKNNEWAKVANGTPAGAYYYGASSKALIIKGDILSGDYKYRCKVSNCQNSITKISEVSNLIINPVPASPQISAVIQPTCQANTGSIKFNNLPSGNWTLVVVETAQQYTGNTTTFTVTGLLPGGYSFYVKNSSGCKSVNTEVITINPAVDSPIAGIINNSGTNILTCSVTEINVTATGGVTYLWSGGSTPTSATNTFTQPGVYLVVVTGSNGCSANASITIINDIVLPIANIINNSGTNILTCSVTEINVTATGGILYQWSGGLSPTSATNTFTEQGIYTVSVTSSNGCSAVASITITSNTEVPNATIINNSGTNILTCSVTEINVTATGGVTYLWSGGATPTSANNTFTQPGVYSVTVTASNNCTATKTIEITQNVVLPVITLSSNSPICSGLNLQLFASGGDVYQWTGPNGFTSNLQNPVIENVQSIASGKYTVVVTISSTQCSATKNINVIVNNQSVGGIITGNNQVCEGDIPAVIVLNGYVGAVVKWKKSVSPFTTWIDIPNATHQYQPGELLETTRFKAIVQNATCSSVESNTFEINVFKKPTAQFSYSANGLQVNFINESINAEEYNWDFSVGSSTETNPVFTFPEKGTYNVSLKANNSKCFSIITKSIYVENIDVAETNKTTLKISPNPSEGIVNVDIDANMINSKMEIYNYLGQLLFNTSLNSKINYFDFSDFKPGLYQVIIYNKTKILCNKLLIK